VSVCVTDVRRPDAGHHFALGQVAVPNDTLVPVLGLEIGMLAEKIRDLGLNRLGQQGTCPVAQNFGELVLDCSWLNQSDELSLGTAYRSFGGEVEASSTPTKCRLPDSRRNPLPAIALRLCRLRSRHIFELELITLHGNLS
jgi:hypothetical protein